MFDQKKKRESVCLYVDNKTFCMTYVCNYICTLPFKSLRSVIFLIFFKISLLFSSKLQLFAQNYSDTVKYYYK